MSDATATESRFIDRIGWPAGPWDEELDRYEWRSPSGMPCLIVRNRLGALCGYVGVPPGHPWHGRSIDDMEDATVHGSVTYASKCFGHICHIAKEGEPEPYWIGFDASHCFDEVPGMLTAVAKMMRGTLSREGAFEYRDVQYTRAEVNGLADQAAAAR